MTDQIQHGTPTMRGEYCTEKGENNETCIFGRNHSVNYHLRPDGSRWGTDPKSTALPAEILGAFSDLIAAVTDAYVAPAEDMDPRERWSKLSLAHQRAEIYLQVMGITALDAAHRASGRTS